LDKKLVQFGSYGHCQVNRSMKMVLQLQTDSVTWSLQSNGELRLH